MPERSMLLTQLWSDKTQRDVTLWLSEHGDPIARARGQVVLALDAYAREIKERGAHDDKVFSAQRFIEDALDRLDATLAPELRAWLEG